MSRFWTIRWRVALSSAAFTLITVTFLVAYFYYRLQRNLDHQMDRFIDDETREMEAVLSRGDEDLRQDILMDEEAHQKFELFVEARDEQGRVILGTKNLGSVDLPFDPRVRSEADAGGHPRSEVRVGGNFVRVRTTRLVFPGGRTRYLQLGLSELEAEESRKAFLSQAAVAILPCAILALAGGFFVARRAMRPVDAMAATASRIRARSLDERIPMSGTGDELDQLARTLNETFGELERSFRRVRDFSASASHQLKTPLTVIRGEAELLVRERPNDPDLARLVTIMDEAARLARIVEQLLFLARADAEKVDLSAGPVDLKAIVERGLRRVEPYVTVKSLKLHVALDGVPEVQGDEALLGTAVQNLLDNAARYTPENGTVRVRWDQVDGRVALEVEDDGPGIPADKRETVMERFSRLVGTEQEGAGLGLAVAREIAQMHGGTLAALDPRDGRGARLRLEVARRRS